MSTLDDLRRVLAEDAGRAPGAEGLVAAAEQGAARIRRRRRIATAGGAAVLVALVAVGTPLVADRRRADGPPPVSTPADRPSGQATLGVDPASGYVLTSQGLDPNGQRISFRMPVAAPGQARLRGTAIAVDPDAGFDPGRLRSGEPATVSGQQAWYAYDYPLGNYMPGPGSAFLPRTELPTPVVGWRDPSGTWVLVFRDGPLPPSREELLQVAQAVRISPSQPVTLPVSLGRLPAGLDLNRVTSDRRTSASVTLGGIATPPDAKWLVGPGPGTGVTIEVQPGAGVPAGAEPVAPVAGHDAWFIRPTLGTSRGNGTLGVRVADCTVTFGAWDYQLPAAQLRKIAAAATYADCEDPASWGPVLRR